MDGSLLLFDRRTGLSVILDGDETRHLRMLAPRVVQFGITNACNLACGFCSRDVDARSQWTPDSAFEFLSELDRAGTLEVAFGGGEPLAFRGLLELTRRLVRDTRLAVSLTTNGTLLRDETAAALAPLVGQVRLSIYDGIDCRNAIEALKRASCPFGINYLVTPIRLPALEAHVLELAARGCSDVLLLSYNGQDRTLHLSSDDSRGLSERVARLARALRHRMKLKLDICWGERMQAVPTLFGSGPCGAGREFVVVTSDKMFMPCSFHHIAFPVGTAGELLELWRRERDALGQPARDPGCARAVDYGLRTRGLLPVV